MIGSPSSNKEESNRERRRAKKACQPSEPREKKAIEVRFKTRRRNRGDAGIQG
jgi:hypothetical protein